MRSVLSLAPVVLLSGVTLANATPVALTNKLTAGDAAAGDNFGYSVGISGSTAIVGAYQDDDNGDDSGSAYLFDTTTGTQTQKLIADDGAANDYFGTSVGLSGTTAIVGAPSDDDNGRFSGSAYLFDTTTGAQTQKLIASDGAARDSFGWSVGISGNLAIVGAQGSGTYSGSAYLFDTTTGIQTHKLTADDGAGRDYFGRSVALSGTTAIVGAPYDDDNGSAYLFNARTGDQIAKLTASDGVSGGEFGYSVGIFGTTAIVGAPFDDDDDNGTNSGAAYLFDLSSLDPNGSVSLTETAKLLATAGAANDLFGWSVGIFGTTAIVGAPYDDDNGSASGSAYFYDIANLSTPVETKLIANDGASWDRFGLSVAISGSTAIVNGDDDNGPASGSAYLYTASAPAPVPLPASLWLLGAAVGGAAGLRRVAQRRRYPGT